MEDAAGIRMENTVHEALDIRIVEATPERVVLEMNVTPRTHQPFGLLHGGVSAVMAESAASMGAYLNCNPATQYAVGIELNISHLRAKRDGAVRAVATPIRKGKSIHVWGVDIDDENDKGVAVARCTIAIRGIEET